MVARRAKTGNARAGDNITGSFAFSDELPLD
jgi:hypothetical protein